MTEPWLNLPASFPYLPPHQQSWSANIQHAHQALVDIYSHTLTVLRQDSDPLRIAYSIDMITSDAIPILTAMEKDDHQLPEEWLHAGAILLGYLVVSLREAEARAKGRCVNFPNFLNSQR
jgi:hypothetical protein